MTNMAKTHHSLEHTIGDLALKKLAKTTPEQMLHELKQQGISNLEDLVKATLETARAGAAHGSVAFDDENFGICYKFTSYRPHIDEKQLGEISKVLTETMFR